MCKKTGKVWANVDEAAKELGVSSSVVRNYSMGLISKKKYDIDVIILKTNARKIFNGFK